MRRLLRGSSGSVIKSHNLRAVLLTLLRNDGISRVRLAELTQLSNTTITNLINELLKQGVVAEDGRRRPRLRRGAGRPQTALRLVPESRMVVAVHFDVDQVNVAVTNLRAQPLITLSAEHPAERPLEVALADTARLVRQAIDQSGVLPERIIGVGVGASGLVDQERGMNVVAPNLGWRDVPLRDWLSAKLRLPVIVENNVRAMAMGEVLFGSGQNSHALAFVYARVGVGAGFVVGGEIYRGSGAGAGEIGHMTIVPDGGMACRCGNTGCLETLVSEPAIVRAARDLAIQNSRSLLAEMLRDGQGTLIERILAAARAGDPIACSLLESRARYMGIALANIINILNPEQIVMGGLFAQAQDLLMPTVEATMRERAFANLGDRVDLHVTPFGYHAGVIGAAAVALQQYFYQSPTSPN